MTELLFKLFGNFGLFSGFGSGEQKSPKAYPFSSKRQHDRAARQGLHNVVTNVTKGHNTVLNAKRVQAK